MTRPQSQNPSITLQANIPRNWIITWILIYIIIIGFSLISPNNPILTIIKVGSILLCLVYALITYPQDHFLQLALLTTFIADVILAINNTAIIGIIIFLITQIIHTSRLHSSLKSSQIILSIFTILAAVAITTTAIIDDSVVIFTTCAFYLTLLISNIITSWQWQHRSPNNSYAWSAALGFTLFLCCDIWTGISFLAFNNLITPVLYPIANFFVWFFYYPAQVLISNSSTLQPPTTPSNSLN